MAYSATKYRKLMGSTLALVVAGIAMVFWLIHNRVDPVSVGMFRVVFSVVVVCLALWAYTYRDEVQRAAQQRRWFLGSIAGIAAMAPVVISLQTHKDWLDAAVQFFFHHTGGPAYYSLGVITPVIFQVTAALILRLADKLSQGPQS